MKRTPFFQFILLSLVVFSPGALSASSPTRTDVHIAYTCPAAGSFTGCTPASGMYAPTNAYVVTSVFGLPSSETARLNGRAIRPANASHILKERRIAGQWRWWPVSHEKGSFEYVAISASGAARTVSINLR